LWFGDRRSSIGDRRSAINGTTIGRSSIHGRIDDHCRLMVAKSSIVNPSITNHQSPIR
jgi:hypothetical protein